MTPDSASFTRFVEEVARPLRQALVARYGPDAGDEATSEALAYAWENWERVTQMSNAAGYLYRVGQSRARSGIRRRRTPLVASRPVAAEYWYEPKLIDALNSLSPSQRAAVVLVNGLGWSVTEVAELWGVSFSTVQSHVERAMSRLRRKLGVTV
ncbi:MAG TPA: sigma-70 family RNA polymerase sigma factor [Acidimicrobiia bacterium]|nr:sigma-70 family RNA polymerase sigma factor [Acidimicrobiia bacterium]